MTLKMLVRLPTVGDYENRRWRRRVPLQARVSASSFVYYDREILRVGYITLARFVASCPLADCL